MNKLYSAPIGDGSPDGLSELELIASELPDESWAPGGSAGASDGLVDRYQRAQRRLWLGLRAQGNPWLITDFITLGTPMYFADRLYTKKLGAFVEKVKRWELPTCPPQDEGIATNNVNNTSRWFSYNNDGRRVLYLGAPFAVTRWTNMWFPTEWAFFGDFFGHRLSPLFGNGIRDIPLKKNVGMKKWFRVAPSPRLRARSLSEVPRGRDGRLRHEGSPRHDRLQIVCLARADTGCADVLRGNRVTESVFRD